MKKLIIVFGLFLTSCGGQTNIYIYSNGKNDSIKIDSNTTTIDTIMLDGNDTVDIRIDKEEG